MTVDELAARARLDDEIRPPAGDPAAPGELFVTGATGFLGGHLLAELLARTDRRVVCLTRSKEADRGLGAVRANLEKLRVLDEGAFRRVRAAAGDLAKPLLGLPPEEFDALAASVSAVYHGATWVNHLYPYEALEPSNVGGTREALRLACRGRAKTFHFVSSIAVGARSEDVPLEQGDPPLMAYLQTKWVAEKLVWLAAARGVRCAVYRPGLLTWSTSTGASSPAQIDGLLLRACAELGAMPEDDVMARLLPNATPVDYAARAIAALSLSPASCGKAFHVLSPRRLDWGRVARAAQDAGRPLERLPLEGWRERLKERARKDPSRMELATLRGLLAERLKVVKTSSYSSELTARAAEAAGVPFPEAEPSFPRFLDALAEEGTCR